jgi:hypothetical protein
MHVFVWVCQANDKKKKKKKKKSKKGQNANDVPLPSAGQKVGTAGAADEKTNR